MQRVPISLFSSRVLPCCLSRHELASFSALNLASILLLASRIIASRRCCSKLCLSSLLELHAFLPFPTSLSSSKSLLASLSWRLYLVIRSGVLGFFSCTAGVAVREDV